MGAGSPRTPVHASSGERGACGRARPSPGAGPASSVLAYAGPAPPRAERRIFRAPLLERRVRLPPCSLGLFKPASRPTPAGRVL